MVAMEIQLYTDDLVADKTDSNQIGEVERTYEDVSTHEPALRSISAGKDITRKQFKKFLREGIPPKDTVVVHWRREQLGSTLVLISSLELVDRCLLVGDVVKRASSDTMSGVVIDVCTICVLQPIGNVQVDGVQALSVFERTMQNWNHALRGNDTLRGFLPTGEHYELPNDAAASTSERPPPLLDIPASELRYCESINEEDLFVYKARLGRIEELTCHITLRLLDNSVVEIHEDLIRPAEPSAAVAVGDIASASKAALRKGKWIFGKYNPNTQPTGTVVALRVETAEVTWLQRRIGAAATEQPPNTLERTELESSGFLIYDRSRPAKHDDGQSPSATISSGTIDVSPGIRVRFRDAAAAGIKYDGTTRHGKLHRVDRQDTLGYDLNVFDVTRYRTEMKVQWQDLTLSQERSTDLIPDLAVDSEIEVWPSEIAHTSDLLEVPGQDGLWQPTRIGVVQTVDSSGRMATMRWSEEGYVQYQKSADHGHAHKYEVARIVGQAKGVQEEVSLYDLEATASANVRRGDIVLLDQGRCRDSEEQADIDWIGEIVDTCLDGTLTIRLGAAKEVRDVNLTREYVHIAVRSDGTDDPSTWPGDQEMGSDDDSEDSMGSEQSSGWNSFDEEEVQTAVPTYHDENGEILSEDEVENEEWESDVSGDEDLAMTDASPATPTTPPTSNALTPTGAVELTNHDRSDHASDGEHSNSPEQYVILEGSTPASHHYCLEPSIENAARMKRVQKEHKMLRSNGNLPSGVYVRTWENRLDLIRCLIVGPSETPYVNSPFVIDFFLPAAFPSEPPQAFIHSWILESSLGGGSWSLNPNLYEDGKICLSLLGTWSGAKSEGWGASRSTLLQVIVSILGLVLVREPFFNEAGYEPRAGLESYKRPSAAYSEGAYLRANSFMAVAVRWINAVAGAQHTSIEGLEDVVRWLYKDPDGKQLLESKIREVEYVLECSEHSTAEPDGLGIVSKGACIPLRRVLAALKEL